MLEILASLINIACIVYILWFVFADDILSRVMPKYAAKRRIKLRARFERQLEKSKIRQARKAERAAKRRPNNSVAKPVLDRLHDGDYGSDPENFKREVDVSQQAELEWALAHPDSPVGKRHLLDSLDRARLDYAHASYMVERYQFVLESNSLDQAEREDYQSRMLASSLELESTRQSIVKIELELGVDALTEQ